MVIESITLKGVDAAGIRFPSRDIHRGLRTTNSAHRRPALGFAGLVGAFPSHGAYCCASGEVDAIGRHHTTGQRIRILMRGTMS